MGQVKKVSVEIFGDHYSLMSDEPEERLLQLSSKVDSLMRDIKKKSGSKNQKFIAVLAALQMCNSLVSLEEALHDKHQTLINLLDEFQ